MITEPIPHEDQKNANEELNPTGQQVPPAASEASQAHHTQEATKQQTQGAQNIMRMLKAMGGGIALAINWLDEHAGFLSALATVAIAVLTGVYVHYSRAQWSAVRDQLPELRKSSNVAKGAAEIAARQLELTERPWVDADVRINGPFDFNVNGGNLHVLITLQNSGHSPAFNTTINPRLITIFGGPDPFRTRTETCQQAVQQAKHYGLGISLFPTRLFQQPMTLTFSHQDMAEAQRSMRGKLPNRITGLDLILCLAYRPTFNDTSIYTTGYIFDIRRIDEKTNLPRIDFPIGTDIDANHLDIKLGPGSILAN